jgi:hypothetical protein
MKKMGQGAAIKALESGPLKTEQEAFRKFFDEFVKEENII